jgi:hypothetical protein
MTRSSVNSGQGATPVENAPTEQKLVTPPAAQANAISATLDNMLQPTEDPTDTVVLEDFEED